MSVQSPGPGPAHRVCRREPLSPRRRAALALALVVVSALPVPRQWQMHAWRWRGSTGQHLPDASAPLGYAVLHHQSATRAAP